MVHAGMRRPRFRLSTLALLVAAALVPAAARADLTKLGGVLALPVEEDNSAFDGDSFGDARVKGGIARSMGGSLAARLHEAVTRGHLPPPKTTGRGNDGHGNGKDDHDNANVQANDPNLDHVVTFTQVATRPFEFATQSETSAVMDGRHIVVGYNSSANAVVEFFPGFGLAFTQLMFSAFSTSHDGGNTWTSGFLPPVSSAAPFTFGDPALAIDRHGNIFYASLGVNADGSHSTVNVNRSTDHGTTFGAATVVAVDDGSDKEWIAIGPDPLLRSRDNIYITWTSFISDDLGNTTGSQIWLARSIDGGATFLTRPLFVPVDDGRNSAFATFTNPVVDASSGRLYVPFLHFSDENADNVRVAVSDDGGTTFRFLAFNVPGAVDAFAYPNVTPGQLIDCRSGGIRTALVAGPDQGGSPFGLPVPKQATRLITQPAAAAVKGAFMFVVNTSTSASFGDPSAGSEINAVYSPDGGHGWSTLKVAASTTADPQHVHPALSLSGDGHTANVSYYVQQSDSRLRTDIARLGVSGDRLRLKDQSHLSSTAFDLTPSNVRRTATSTTNFDRAVQSCYDIGEYQALARQGGDGGNATGQLFAAWGDNRQTWIGPPGSPAPGPHAQPDVFTASLNGNDN
jgi:hypothetical protein